MGELNRILLESGAFKELERPVILASGHLGIYYINTEKILNDNNKFKDFTDDIEGMASHCDKLLETNKDYNFVIDALADRVGKEQVIAGGQTRDWIFSVPVSKKLCLPHYWIFKPKFSQQSKMFVTKKEFGYYTDDGLKLTYPSLIRDRSVFHIADLATKGNSTYNPEKESGWVPTIRSAGGKISQSLVVVDRNQGAKDILSQTDVELDSLILIDEKFLEAVSVDKKRSLAYFENPHQWSREYIKNNSIAYLADDFDPQGNNKGRAIQFYRNYFEYFTKKKHEELAGAIMEKFGRKIEEYI